MKLYKRIFALMLALCLSTVSTTVSFASDVNSTSVAEEDYMNYEFPDGAEVLYQSEDGVVYTAPTAPDVSTYASSWKTVHKRVDGGKYEQGSFAVTNPHTIVKTTNGFFCLDSTNVDAAADMILSDGANILASKRPLKGTDRNVYFSFKSKVKNLTVIYTIQNTKSGCPIFMYCGLS